MGITLNQVTFGYQNTPILQNCSITFPSNGKFCIYGPSGCGKTTLFRLICGLEKPSSGNIILPQNGTFSVVFQENRLLPWKTALENIKLTAKSDDFAKDMLTLMELNAYADFYPHNLSGGMQRRISIARALAFDGDFLLMDEPFSGIDSILKEKISRYILNLYKDRLILLITHHMQEAELFHMTKISFHALCGSDKNRDSSKDSIVSDLK